MNVNFFFLIIVIFFTIMIWYYGINDAVVKTTPNPSDVTKNVLMKRVCAGIKWIENQKTWICPGLLGIITGLLPKYIRIQSMFSALWLFLYGCLFLYMQFGMMVKPKDDFKINLSVTVTLLAANATSINEFMECFTAQLLVILIMLIRIFFILIYQKMKIKYQNYTNLIITIIWTMFFMLWIEKFFSITSLYFLVLVFAWIALDRCIMHIFPIKNNTLFRIAKIVLVFLAIITWIKPVVWVRNLFQWDICLGYGLLLLEMLYSLSKLKKK